MNERLRFSLADLFRERILLHETEPIVSVPMRFWLAAILCLVCALGAKPRSRVQLGNETLFANQFKELRGKRVGLLTNKSGVDGKGASTVDLLRRAPGVKLVALFAPEHGLHGDIPAGKEFPDEIDRRTGLKVYSLYRPGAVLRPTPGMLKGIDALVYDVQDTGCRSYTFISSMGLAMQSCAEAGVEFVVLDRPNPIGGIRVEGPMLDPKFRSMVGEWPVPYVYGMTCGELARMINGEGWSGPPCRLTVVPLKRWRRTMVWRDTGLRWVATSPHIPHADSPLFYPTTGMLGWFGGLNIGIREKMPFECMAAAWLDGKKLKRALEKYSLAGLSFEPITFVPANSGNKKQTVSGVRIRFTDPAQAPKLAVSFYALEAIRNVSGHDLFAQSVKEGKDFAMFDKLNGTDATRRELAAGKSAPEIVGSWRAGEEAFRKKREKYLLY